ncbi:MAG TPA: pitrilysin family protein [Methylomirabilota bacterium]|jgi:zinc protease
MFALRPLVLIAAVFLTGCAAGNGGRSATSPVAPATPTRAVLDNGVVLIAREHRASDLVSLQLWLRVGGRDEMPAELGLSHYLEHMLFKGTPTRPPGSIDYLIEGLGGQSNAFTSYDFTHFDVMLPVEHVRTGLELLADIAVNASFPPEEIDRERKVVFEEMSLVEDDPEKYLLRQVYEQAYRPHPYGRPILGTPELVRDLTRERLAAYYGKHYVAPNMVIVVVGALTTDEIRPLVDATFGRLPKATSGRPAVAGASWPTTRRTADVRRSEQQAYLGLAWRTAATDSEDVFAVDLLTYILGDSPSSRLNQIVRDRDRLVSTIEAAYGAWAKGGLVTVTSRLDASNLDAAERSILEVIRRVRADGVTEAERQRAIVTAESSYAFDIETADGLAKSYGQAETTWELAKELRYLARLRQVTAAEIVAAARKYFGDDNYTRVRFVPGEGAR